MADRSGLSEMENQGLWKYSAYTRQASSSS
jgi:hypothetical protein